MSYSLWLVTIVLLTLAVLVEGKTWIFTVSGNRRPYNYIDETGKVAGFELDLVKNVCHIAEEKCSITVQPFTECTQTIRDRFFPGRGIMSGWFDACVGYTITQERTNALQFTDPYLYTVAKLAVKPGNPRRVSLKTLANKTITHLMGAYTNQQCLTRLELTVADIVVASNLSVAKNLVLNGTVDAAFSPRSQIPDLEIVKNVTLHCDLGGVAVMVPKDSSLPDWWNPSFRKLVQTGEYKRICEDWMKKWNNKYKIKCKYNLSAGSARLTTYMSIYSLSMGVMLLTSVISGTS